MIAAALPLVACMNMGMNDMAEPAGEGMMPAAASDVYEIPSSRLALQRTEGADVRAFAQTMIDDHNRTSAALAAAAQAAGMALPPVVCAMGRQNMAALRAASSGAAFNQLYLSQQRTARQMALQLHQSYAANGDSAALSVRSQRSRSDHSEAHLAAWQDHHVKRRP